MRKLILVSLSSVLVAACSGGEVIDLGGDAGQSRGSAPLGDVFGTSNGAGTADGGSSSGGGTSSGAGASSDAGDPIEVPNRGSPTSVYPFPDASALVCTTFDGPSVDAGGDSYSVPLPATGSPASASDGWILFESDVDSDVASIYAIHPDGSGMTLLVSGGSEAAVSPDGSEFANTYGGNATPQVSVTRHGADGKPILSTTSVSGGAGQAAFSPDGKLIAFHSGSDVYVMNVDGSGVRAVTAGGAGGFEHPTFSPDGNMLIVDRDTEIDVFDLSGNLLGPVVGNFPTEEQWPALSRDGHELAFITGGCNPSIGVSRLLLVAFGADMPDPCNACPASGSHLGLLSHPSWGPGTLITYSHLSSNGLKRIVVADTAHPDEEPVEILQDMGNQQNPVWAPSTFDPATFP